MEPAGGRERVSARDELRWFAELVGACGLAVAAPVLDVFGNSPETFVFEGLGRWQVVAFGVLVAVLPPVLLWIPGLLVGRFASARVRRVVHAATLGVLVVAFLDKVLRDATPLIDVPLLLVSALLAASAAMAYWRWEAIRTFVLFTLITPLLALGVFLFSSPVSALVLPPAALPPAASGVDAPVVFLLFDEFPTAALLDGSGEIDTARYPGFARLARETTWYRNATTNAGVTTRAIPMLFTGRYVDDGIAAVSREHPDNLFTWLRESHDMRSSELVTRLCPSSVCPPPRREHAGRMLDDAWDVFYELALPGEPSEVDTAQFEEQKLAVDIDHTKTDRESWTGPRNAPERFVSFVEGFDAERESERPGFHFLHLTLPHHPYRYFPDGTQYALEARGQPGLGFDQWLGEAPTDVARVRFSLQVQYVDTLITQMIERLETLDVWDDALVVVTADHGGSFTPGTQFRGLSDPNLHEIMAVPLFVKGPDQRGGGIDDTNVQSVDVVPTIAELLDAEVPWDVDGTPATRIAEGSEKTYLLSDAFEDPEAIPDGWLTVAPDLVLDRLRTVQPIGARGDDPLDIFRITSNGDLVGRPVGTLDIEARDTRLQVHGDVGVFDDVELDDGEIPAVVHALLYLSQEERSFDGREIAVALNGRIGAVVRSFNDYEGEAFGALLPLELFREGPNELRVFEVRGDDADRRLHEFTVEPGEPSA